MRVVNRKAVVVLLVLLPLTAMYFYYWNLNSITTINVLQGPDSLKMILEKRSQSLQHTNDHIPYQIKDDVFKSLALNGCVCEGNKPGITFPFSKLLFPEISATRLEAMFDDSDLQKAKQYRSKEYQRYRKR